MRDHRHDPMAMVTLYLNTIAVFRGAALIRRRPSKGGVTRVLGALFVGNRRSSVTAAQVLFTGRVSKMSLLCDNEFSRSWRAWCATKPCERGCL